ncbi:MAG: DNA primase [Mycoplasmoidaceae bacterium]
MIYKDNVIKELLDQADLVNIISETVELKKKGANYVGLCPFHNDTEPSFFVSPQKKIFKCFACGEGGNVFTFIQKQNKLDFISAVKLVAEKSNYQLPIVENKFSKIDEEKHKFFTINEQALFIFQKMLYAPHNQKLLQYLYQLGLDDELIKYFQIGASSQDVNLLFKIMTNDNNFLPNKKKEETWSAVDLLENGLVYLDQQNEYKDFFRDRIIFPIKDKFSKVIGFSGRSINHHEKIKYLNSKSHKFFAKEKALFNIEKINNENQKELFITEGFMDVISLYKKGYKNAIALMGTNFSLFHLQMINDLNFRSIILAMDNDQAGYKANIDIGMQVLRSNKGLMVLNQYDEKYKDLGELINFDQNLFDKIIHNNITYVEYLINYSFQKINLNSISEKMHVLNQLEDFIAKNADINLIGYYIEILAKITNISSFDIRKAIDKRLNINTDILNKIATYQEVSQTTHHNVADFNSFRINKIYEMEKKLILLMCISPKITERFKKKLNFLQIEDSDKSYNILRKQISVLYEMNNNYLPNDILKLLVSLNLPIDFRRKIEREIKHYVEMINENNYFSLSDLISQGNLLIEELVAKKRVKSDF